ncbi:MAG: GNAT family N-acyltransferase [Pseudomonadota bacterium]
MNSITGQNFRVDIAQDDADLHQAQRLRYDVFVAELGGDGPEVDHQQRQERDRYDPYATHLLLRDLSRRPDDNVVGVYRVLTSAGAKAAGQFYCEDEYDLTSLKNGPMRLLELGRSCLHRDYRGGAGLVHLWGALSEYVSANRIDVLFGVASFHGTDVTAKAPQLSLLHHHYRAPERYRVHAIGPTAHPMDIMPANAIDRVAVMRDMPPLIKAYLRLGGTVGAGAFVDHAFNTTDVCLILPTAVVPDRQRQRFEQGTRARG